MWDGTAIARIRRQLFRRDLVDKVSDFMTLFLQFENPWMTTILIDFAGVPHRHDVWVNAFNGKALKWI